jgi:hypothetical protein
MVHPSLVNVLKITVERPVTVGSIYSCYTVNSVECFVEDLCWLRQSQNKPLTMTRFIWNVSIDTTLFQKDKNVPWSQKYLCVLSNLSAKCDDAIFFTLWSGFSKTNLDKRTFIACNDGDWKIFRASMLVVKTTTAYSLLLMDLTIIEWGSARHQELSDRGQKLSDKVVLFIGGGATFVQLSLWNSCAPWRRSRHFVTDNF